MDDSPPVARILPKEELVALASARLRDPKLSNGEFIKLSQLMVDLHYDERRPHRSRKWVMDRAKKLETERHAKYMQELGVEPKETDLADVITQLESR
jgi:hypothetical protein